MVTFPYERKILNLHVKPQANKQINKQPQRWILARLVKIGPVVIEEKMRMCRVERHTTHRRTSSYRQSKMPLSWAFSSGDRNILYHKWNKFQANHSNRQYCIHNRKWHHNLLIILHCRNNGHLYRIEKIQAFRS